MPATLSVLGGYFQSVRVVERKVELGYKKSLKEETERLIWSKHIMLVYEILKNAVLKGFYLDASDLKPKMIK